MLARIVPTRVWLEPSKETNTYGRDKFSIHCGWVAGSAGCINLIASIHCFAGILWAAA